MTDRQTDRQADRQAGRETDRQTDRQTDMTRLIMAFRNISTNVPKNAYLKNNRMCRIVTEEAASQNIGRQI